MGFKEECPVHTEDGEEGSGEGLCNYREKFDGMQLSRGVLPYTHPTEGHLPYSRPHPGYALVIVSLTLSCSVRLMNLTVFSAYNV